MHRHLNTFRRRIGPMSASLALVGVLVLTGCGPLGDDDETPTATSESITQPTSEATEGGETPAQSNTPTKFVPGTPPPFLQGTPVPPETVVETGPFATPSDEAGVAVGTPEADATPGASPVTGPAQSPPETAAASSFSGSDGTSGATPPLDGGGSQEDVVSPATPGAATPFFVEEVATPLPASAGATPQVGELDELEPLQVTSCNPDVIPPFGGEQTSFVTNIDVNFRTGPGADCDQISTIGQNASVTLLSAPVTREGEDDLVWVQVEIAGEVGWVIVSVLDPAS